MPIAMAFDERDVRSDLLTFTEKELKNQRILTTSGSRPWDGLLPRMTGDFYHESPWIVTSGAYAPSSEVFSALNADNAKSCDHLGMALSELEESVDWAIFSCGGYARYGMLGTCANDIAFIEKLPVKRWFRYSGASSFCDSVRCVLARRTRIPFADHLWRILDGEKKGPIIITFRYYDEAFEGSRARFSVEGEFPDTDGTPLSIYRVLDYASFEYFIGLVNNVGVLDIISGDSDMSSCAQARRAADSLDFQSVLKLVPWLLTFNGGEIDTSHVLFASSDHALTKKFISHSGGSLEFISYF